MQHTTIVANFKGSLEPYLYISPGIIFFGTASFMCSVLKVGNSCSQICLATIQHLVSNLFYLTMQKFLEKAAAIRQQHNLVLLLRQESYLISEFWQ